MNAQTNGLWARQPLAIGRGNFVEDAAAVERHVADIVDSLKPKGALQEAQAMNVATLYLRLARLRRFEAEALAGVGRPRTGPRVDDSIFCYEFAYVQQTVDWILGLRDDADMDFVRVVAMLVRELKFPDRELSRVLADNPDPDEQGYMRIARAMLAERFADDATAALWGVEVAARWEGAVDSAVASREQAARRAVRDDLDSAARVHARINRELQRALNDYGQMRDGELS